MREIYFSLQKSLSSIYGYRALSSNSVITLKLDRIGVRGYCIYAFDIGTLMREIYFLK